jgi:hypothetical protein
MTCFFIIIANLKTNCEDYRFFLQKKNILS